MRLEKKTVKVNGNEIHYYIYGKGSPLLFIHSQRSDSQRWEKLLRHLGKKFKVYSPDLPGFGKSPAFKKGWHTMSRYADCILAFTEKVDLHNYVLFGISMGGIIALYMLNDPRLSAKKLVLFGTPYDKKAIKASLPAKLLVSSFLKTVIDSEMLTFIADKLLASDFFLYRLSKRILPQEYQAEDRLKFEMSQWQAMSAKVWLQTFYDILQVNFSSEKKQYSIPTLIGSSTNDPYIKIEENSEGLRKLLPNSTIVIVPFKDHVPAGKLTSNEVKRLAGLFESA